MLASTFFPAIEGNETTGYAVDNFKSNPAPFRDDIVFTGYEDPKAIWEKEKTDRKFFFKSNRLKVM